MPTGVIGILPFASRSASRPGTFEPSHRSAPSIAGQNVADSSVTILSIATMLRCAQNEPTLTDRLVQAGDVLDQRLCTADTVQEGARQVSTLGTGDAAVAALRRRGAQ